MEFKGLNNISELIELVKKSNYDEDPGDILTMQFLNNAKVTNVDPMPYIDNDGIGHYEYGSEVGYDAGKDYLVLDGSATLTTMVEIEPLLYATESPHLSKSPEDLKEAINKFFLEGDNRADTEFILGEIMGDNGKPKLNDSFSEMYDEQKMKLVLNDISISETNNKEVYLTITVSWEK